MIIQDFKDLISRTMQNNGRGITIGSIIKFTILAIVAMLALSVVLAMFKWTFGINDNEFRPNEFGLKQMFEEPASILGYAESMVVDQDFGGSYGGGLAVRSASAKMMAPDMDIMPMPPLEPASKDAEDFETRDYRVNYEKSNINKTCQKFEDLKPLEYVVFSNANKSDTYCDYSFKVEADREQEVILLIESLDPKDFNASTFTLERSITNNDNEVAILEKKLKMLDSLLESAQEKYSKLRNTGNTSALVQAINNEINLIERITNQKLNVQSRIDRLTNSTGVQKERIDYSQFNISVRERKFINLSNIGESWSSAIENFVTSTSSALQDLTIGLLMFIFKLVKFVLYIGIAVMLLTFATRFLWKMIRKVWQS